MPLVRIVKDWDWPDLMRQTPGQAGKWDGIDFTVAAVGECDFLVMLNNRMPQAVSATCPPEHIWMIVQEPYYRGLTDWVVEKHQEFTKVFTHLAPKHNSGKYITAAPAIPWHINRTFDQLTGEAIPEKKQLLSWVVGTGQDLPGHIRRTIFLRFLQDSDLAVDLWGRAVRPIKDKWDGLAPYFFSIAVENNSGPDMWTEKLADCFLSWSIPFYCGCTNLEKYFPAESFIQIDLADPEKALAIIKKEARPENWRLRLPALKKARELVLTRYQLFPFLAEQVRQTINFSDNTKKLVSIPPYRRSLDARLFRLLYKVKRHFNFFETA